MNNGSNDFIGGYMFCPEAKTNENIGVYKDVQVLDISSMHPNMFMSKKSIRKVKLRMFWWDICHFTHLYLAMYAVRRKWRMRKAAKKGARR